jgi:amidase
VFWAGLPGVSFLPATVIPTGVDDMGLPIGVQIVGPEYGDLITIGVAERLERIGYAFTPPPGY